MELLKDRLAWAVQNAPEPHPVTQADLARWAGVKPPSVNDWLSGKSKEIKVAPLFGLARRLNVNPEWLGTGKGKRRLNDSQQAATAGDLRPVPDLSQPAIFDPDTLHEALTLLLHDESHGGAYSLRGRTKRLIDLYARVAADGGRLTKRHNDEFEAEVRERARGGKSGATELAERRAARRRG